MYCFMMIRILSHRFIISVMVKLQLPVMFGSNRYITACYMTCLKQIKPVLNMISSVTLSFNTGKVLQMMLFGKHYDCFIV